MKKLMYGFLITFVVLFFTGCGKETVNKEDLKTLTCVKNAVNDDGKYVVDFKDDVAEKAVYTYYVDVPEDPGIDIFYDSFNSQFAAVGDENGYNVEIAKIGADKLSVSYVFEFDDLIDYEDIEVEFVLEKDFSYEEYKTILTSHGYTCTEE